MREYPASHVCCVSTIMIRNRLRCSESWLNNSGKVSRLIKISTLTLYLQNHLHFPRHIVIKCHTPLTQSVHPTIARHFGHGPSVQRGELPVLRPGGGGRRHSCRRGSLLQATALYQSLELLHRGRGKVVPGAKKR